MTRDIFPANRDRSVPQMQRYTIARFAFDVVSARRMLPLVTETLPVAEQVRRSLLARCRKLVRRCDASLADAAIWRLSPAFWGKDQQGRPRIGHEHAFFLPTDEDGDGRLDHITLFAPMGFNGLETQAIDKLRRLPFGDGGSFPLLLVALGCERDFRIRLLEAATVWLSATPFLPTRFPKRRGQKRDRPEHYALPRDFARHILHQELQRRPNLPRVVSIQDVEAIGSHQIRPSQFHRCRGKAGDDGDRRAAGGFQIRFASAIRGPICLGHACHFGLGLFLPAVRPRAVR